MTTKVGPMVQSSTSVAAGGTLRSRVDLSSSEGGIIHYRMTNGPTGPTAPCVMRIMIARKQAAMPAAAAEGVGDDDWKQVYEQSAGTVAGASTRSFWRFGPEIAYVQIEWSGHTGQAVTVEATAHTFA